MHVSIEGLEALIEEKVAEAVARLQLEDPWLSSASAAAYLDVKRQRIFDLVSQGRLPRHGEKGTGLRFRRSELDAYAAGRS
jgi:excisionase family DNA binding protein